MLHLVKQEIEVPAFIDPMFKWFPKHWSTTMKAETQFVLWQNSCCMLEVPPQTPRTRQSFMELNLIFSVWDFSSVKFVAMMCKCMFWILVKRRHLMCRDFVLMCIHFVVTWLEQFCRFVIVWGQQNCIIVVLKWHALQPLWCNLSPNPSFKCTIQWVFRENNNCHGFVVDDDDQLIFSWQF